MLGLDEASSKSVQFFIAQASSAVAHGFRWSRFFMRIFLVQIGAVQIRLVRIMNALFNHVARFCGNRSRRSRVSFACLRFGFIVSKQPMWQAPGITAARICARRQTSRRARWRRFEIRLAFFGLVIA